MATPKNAQPETQIISPLSVLKAVWNRRMLIACSWLVFTALVVVVVQNIRPVYRAEGLVQVESQRIPERYVSATVNENLQDRLNLLRQQILSYSRLLQIVDKYNLYSEYRKKQPTESIVERMRDDIGITLERGLVQGRPNAFRVSYIGPDPSIVAQVTNLIANFFIEENLRAREVEAVGTSEFLDVQLAEAKTRLEQQEEQLSRYKLMYKGELPQQENAMLSSLSQLKVQLTGAQDSINRAQQTKLGLESSLDSAIASDAVLAQLSAPPQAQARETQSGPASAGTPAAPAPVRESERLQQQLLTLRMRYSDSHPEVKRVTIALQRALESEAHAPAPAPAPVASAQASPARPPAPPPAASPQAIQAATASRERINSIKAQIKAAEQEIETLKTERQNILREIAAVESRVSKLPVREQQLAAVTRDYQITMENYRGLLDKKLAADLAADMERRQKSERFILLEVARVPEQPIKPKRLLLDIMGSGFGFALCLVLGLALELKKGTVLGEWELPKDVAVLGYVPPIAAGSPSAANSAAGPKPPFKRVVLVCALAALALLAAVAGGAAYLGFWKVGA